MTWNIGVYQNDNIDIGVSQDFGIGTISFGANNYISFVNHRVYFFNNSSNSNFYWSFGDGSTSESRNPFHCYQKAGIYYVELIIEGIGYSLNTEIIIFEESFIIDSGAVYINYDENNQRLLGATEGGNQFGLETEYRKMSFDNVKGELTGSHRIIGSIPKIIANIIEINYELLNMALPGSFITFQSGSVEIKRAIKKLLESDYINNISIVAQHGGTGCYIVFKILNAITIEDIEIPFEDSAESVIECTFAGCFTPDDQKNEPWTIDFITIN